jgi:uncharacterized radical SAM superfamily protein
LPGVFRAYHVWPDFPSISLSGGACALDCRHCAGVYLRDMHPAATPEELVSLCERLRGKGARGVLLSGGCDANGRLLNLAEMMEAIGQVRDMGLIIKLHTGLVDKGLAREIANAGVDIASQEMVGDASTIGHVFGIRAAPEDYLATLKSLQDAGVPHVCPHVCVGLHDGRLMGEKRALEMLSEIDISTLAIIVLRPTKGTALESAKPPTGEMVAEVVSHARRLFPHTKLVLGSLRPRGSETMVGLEKRLAIERAAVDSGVDGIELPHASTLEEMKKKGGRREILRVDSYGVLPAEYESRVRTSWL